MEKNFTGVLKRWNKGKRVSLSDLLTANKKQDEKKAKERPCARGEIDVKV